MARPLSAKDLLIKARHFLARHKWGQKDYHSIDGAYCAIGALDAVFYGRGYVDGEKLWSLRESQDIYDSAVRLLDQIALRLANKGTIGYNDTPGRRKKDVLALYDQAIEVASV